MSTTANGYILDLSDEDGVGIIPAPPSPQEGNNKVNPNQLSFNYGGINSTIASIGSACPSRDSVSAAIALVRAKQVAKSAILRAEEQILQPRSVSSDQTSASVATDSSMKEKAISVNEMVESENAVPIISENKDKLTSKSKAPTDSLISVDSQRVAKQRDRNSSLSSVKDASSLSSEVQQRCSSSASLPQGPSFEQTPDQPSSTMGSSSDYIPGPPSLATNESGDSDFDETVDANTIEDVNAFLSRLGVGALHSASNESNNSIDRLRMLSSGSNGASSDGMESNGSSLLKVQPETLAEISAIIDEVAKKQGEREEQQEEEVLQEKKKIFLNECTIETETEAQTRENCEKQVSTSRPSPTYELLGEPGDRRDPLSILALEAQSHKADPPGPSHSSEAETNTYHTKGDNPFLSHSFSGESLEDNPLASPSVTVEDERKIEESNEKNARDEEFETLFVDESFAATVHKTLSTVEEVGSKDDDSTNENDLKYNNDAVNCDDALSSSIQGIDNLPQPFTLSAVASEEQESVYGADGRKEPKGTYVEAKVEVEKIPLSNIGVEQAIKNNMSLMSTDSQQIGTERHAIIGHNETHSKSKASENIETHDCASSVGSRGFSDTGSLPWALRDVASEETMKATGRRRPHFVLSGARPSNKSRNHASLFDDTSQQASETASEFRANLSFGSDDSSGDNEPSKNNEDIKIETSDSIEGDKCILDTLQYDDNDPENDYSIQRGISDNENDEPIEVMDTVGKNSTDSCDSLVGESEVEMMNQNQLEELDDQKLTKYPSSEMVSLEVGQGPLSPTKISKTVDTLDDEHQIEDCKNFVDESQSNSFLRQFEDLGIEDDSEADRGLQLDHDPVLKCQDALVINTVDVISPTVLVNYFSNIDQRKFEGEKEEKLVNDFKRLIMPVINGNIPTLIEEAQIRQAALKANVPLNFVDAFVDYVKDDNLKVTPQVSKEDERDLLSKGWENNEDLDEDDAIAAFLSSKIGVQDLEEGEMSKNGAEGASQKKNTEEFMSADGSRDNEPSIISTIEPECRQVKLDFNKSDGSEVEPNFNVSESEVEPDFNRSGDSNTEPDYNRSEEESDSDVIGCEMNARNGRDESKNSVNESNPIQVPKIVKTSKRDNADLVEIEMLKACKSIESYDVGIWQRRTAMATHGWGWEEATWLSSKTPPMAANLSRASIHGVTASRDVSNDIFNKKSFPLTRMNCRLSYDQRVKSHTGYTEVDMYSLQESAAFGKENLYKDETPWELRHVRQRFLHERSLTFSRNWFGDLVKTSGNDRIKAPICKPKSMEMPMRKIPDPGDWTPEWYTTWGGRKLLLRRQSSESSIDSSSTSYTEKEYYDKDSVRSYSTAGTSYEDDEEWEDAPECGTFVNTKQKIGEHVSRVHPDYTSSLRKSRWRKKYFPIGTFPY